jgi:hypothetical protein
MIIICMFALFEMEYIGTYYILTANNTKIFAINLNS